MAQSVEHPTLDFGSGHDLTVHEISLKMNKLKKKKEIISNFSKVLGYKINFQMTIAFYASIITT